MQKFFLALFVFFAFSCSDYKLNGIDAPVSGADLPELDTSYPEDLPLTDTGPKEHEEPELSQPVAVCSVTPEIISPPFEQATWIGSDSYDPSGEEITQYNWVLVSEPEGSEVIMPVGAANRGPFIPVLAGEYIANLTVVNESGLTSDPCEAKAFLFSEKREGGVL